jgi:hypothetical protein
LIASLKYLGKTSFQLHEDKTLKKKEYNHNPFSDLCKIRCPELELDYSYITNSEFQKSKLQNQNHHQKI